MDRCPVCRASLREGTTCRRCGADLAPLQRIIRESQMLETLSVQALLQGNPLQASDLTQAALSLRHTPMARALRGFLEESLQEEDAY